MRRNPRRRRVKREDADRFLVVLADGIWTKRRDESGYDYLSQLLRSEHDEKCDACLAGKCVQELRCYDGISVLVHDQRMLLS